MSRTAFAHAPSGHFQANAAWLALAALAHNLTRAAGALASAFQARATTATIRDRLINVPARLARSARRLTLHLPERARDLWTKWKSWADQRPPHARIGNSAPTRPARPRNDQPGIKPVDPG